jgi:hypothetical protein
MDNQSLKTIRINQMENQNVQVVGEDVQVNLPEQKQYHNLC